MTKQDVIVKKETGIHVSFLANFEPAMTKDLGNGVLEAIVSSNAIDHYGEIINMDGVNTDNYHGTILYGHDYHGLPIGKTMSMTKFKNKIKARFQLAIKEYPFANTIYEMIKGGYLTDVSIGGIVNKWSEDYRTIEEMVMKEFSVVPIGANPDAMITAKELGRDLDTIKGEYEDFARKVLVDKISDMGEDELKDAIKVLQNLVDRLKDTTQKSTPKDDKIIRHIVLKEAQAIQTQSQRVIKTIKFKLGE